VNAASVDTLIPEYWRTSSPSEGGNDQDHFLMEAISLPAGKLAEMEKRLGPYMAGNDTSVEGGDVIRTRFALDILRNQKPGFMTVHLSAMDESEHESGPFSAHANGTLEAVDGMVNQLMEAELKNDPHAKIVIVSDHGFLTITHTVNLYIPLLQAGLIQLGKHASYEGEKTVVASWKAQLWSAGGVTAVMLHGAADTATKQQVQDILTKLAADPENGIAQVLDADHAKQHGGFSGASFLVVMKPGYTTGAALSGPLVVAQSAVRGSHGFWPLFPEMRSSFFIMGAGVARGRNLGVIDMRQVAPTVANILGVRLPTATQPKLPVLR
jgi:predicted AlkP superfamily pyrophosphatase or phosphodiesterase